MAINKEGTGFTFGFAIIMVVVVGALLSLAAMGLKPFQKENLKQEQMKNILGSVGIEVEMSEASTNFDKFIVKRIMLDSDGNVLNEKSGQIATLANDGQDAFDADPFNVDIKKEYRGLASSERRYPLFICEKDGQTLYIVPMVGKGLWGPIWGFISLKDDLNTVYGANFDHKTETPGLGAEINTSLFTDQFKDDRIFDEKGEFTSIAVKKSATGDNPHAVDGITGGTITSVGVSEMVERTLKVYVPYFKNLKAA